MNKKSQIFLITTIIISLALFSVSIKYNTIKEYPLTVEYKELSNNYLNEMPKIVNYALYENQDPIPLMNDFTNTYVKTTQQKDPNFGVFYTYEDERGLHVVNTLNNRVLNIKIVNTENNRERNILSNGRIQAGGTACIAGLGCTGTRAPANDFGGQWSQDMSIDLKRDEKIVICVNEGDCTDELPGIMNIMVNTEKQIVSGRPRTEFTDSGKAVQFTFEEFK